MNATESGHNRKIEDRAVTLKITAEADRLLSLDEVVEMGPWPKATWRYWRRTDFGPPSAKIGKLVCYRESEVRAWIDQQFEDQAGGQSA